MGKKKYKIMSYVLWGLLGLLVIATSIIVGLYFYSKNSTIKQNCPDGQEWNKIFSKCMSKCPEGQIHCLKDSDTCSASCSKTPGDCQVKKDCTNGKCVGGTCQCDDGWSGPICNVPIVGCNAQNCNPLAGSCISNVCKCNKPNVQTNTTSGVQCDKCAFKTGPLYPDCAKTLYCQGDNTGVSGGNRIFLPLPYCLPSYTDTTNIDASCRTEFGEQASSYYGDVSQTKCVPGYANCPTVELPNRYFCSVPVYWADATEAASIMTNFGNPDASCNTLKTSGNNKPNSYLAAKTGEFPASGCIPSS